MTVRRVGSRRATPEPLVTEEARTSPAAVVALVLALVVMTWGAFQLVEGGGAAAVSAVIWFAGAVLLHDLVAFPAYTAADRALTGAQRSARPRVPWVNHVRVPVVVSLLVLAMLWPSVTRRVDEVGVEDYVWRWLGLTAALSVASAAWYVLRVLRGSRARATTD